MPMLTRHLEERQLVVLDIDESTTVGFGCGFGSVSVHHQSLIGDSFRVACALFFLIA